MFFYLLPAFYSVWTVAYNFVPLGEYTREATGAQIAFLNLILLIGSILNCFRCKLLWKINYKIQYKFKVFLRNYSMP